MTDIPHALRSELVFSGWLRLHALTFKAPDGTDYKRLVEDHGDAVAVLPYDPDRRVAIVVSLLRAPVVFRAAPQLLEVPAGLIDAGETANDAAMREVSEETGLALRGLEPAGVIWSIPGVSTERIWLFLAPYGLEDRIAAGGGLAEEHEDITVHEQPLDALWRDIDSQQPVDAKTRVLLQTLRFRRPDLFSA
jgi:nudix-type nucleoside diphosphatase (YffH/AdpP family)